MYMKTLYAGWSDMDTNSHMASAAYLNRCADIRVMFFEENGFPPHELLRLKVGPVAMKDELEYFREVALLQPINVTLQLAGMAPDGSRWLLRQEVQRTDGKLCARLTSTGGWLDLVARKLIAAPPAILAAMNSITRPADFVELPSSLRAGG